jgi:hypothetical protein
MVARYDFLVDRCYCGRALHYPDPTLQRVVEKLIAAHGARVIVTVGKRSWLVPRHYIALHGLKASELPDLGFEEVFDKGAESPLPVGALVEKINSKPGDDYHADGARGRILSVIPKPTDQGWGYFVEWEDLRGVPVMITGSRIRAVKKEGARGTG